MENKENSTWFLLIQSQLTGVNIETDLAPGYRT